MATQRPQQLGVVPLALVVLLLVARCSPAPSAVLTAVPRTSPASAVVPANIASPAAVATRPVHISTPELAAPAPTIEVPLLMGWENLDVGDFTALHSALNSDLNEYLIFGNIPVDKPSPELSPELAAYLGRWEGYDYGPPVKKDTKIVLIVQSISTLGGKAYLWGASDLQFPFYVKEIRFRVVPGLNPSIVWEGDASGPAGITPGSRARFTFSYDAGKQALVGNARGTSGQVLLGPLELGRAQAFHVFRDYA